MVERWLTPRLKKLGPLFFWGAEYPLGHLVKNLRWKTSSCGFFQLNRSETLAGLGFSIQHDLDESIEPGQWFYPTLCGCTSVFFNHRKGKQKGSPQIEGRNLQSKQGLICVVYMSARQNLRPLGIMKLSGTVGVTPTKWWFFWYWYTCLPDVWIWRHLSINFISARNEASKSIQTLCANSKDIMHKMNTPQKFESERQLRTITKTMTERFLVSESLQTHPRRASGKMATLLVRN